MRHQLGIPKPYLILFRARGRKKDSRPFHLLFTVFLHAREKEGPAAVSFPNLRSPRLAYPWRSNSWWPWYTPVSRSPPISTRNSCGSPSTPKTMDRYWMPRTGARWNLSMIFGVLTVLRLRVLTAAPTGRLSLSLSLIRAPAIRRGDHNRRGKYRRHARNDRRTTRIIVIFR